MSRRTRSRKTLDAPERYVKTADGFLNLAGRQGMGANNILSDSTYVPSGLSRMRVALDNMYRSSWIVGTAVDAVAEDMTRSGIAFTSEVEPEKLQQLQAKMRRMGIWKVLLNSLKWSRLYGGALTVIVIEGQKLDTPLDMSTIAKGAFQGLHTYDRWQLSPSLTELIQEGVDAGLPKYYHVTTDPAQLTMSDVRLHHSRVIRHIGVQLPWWQAQQEQMWGQSIVERLHDRLVAFDSSTMGAANLVQRAHLRTVQVEGLREVLAAGGPAEANLLKMFSEMRFLQSTEGLTVLDTKDKFEASSYTFSGLSDVILQFGQQIAGAAGIPLVRLFGQSPAGLNSTGESDLRMYYDHVSAQQESRLHEGLLTVACILYQSTFGTPAPDDFDFTFEPLWQTSEKEKTDIADVATKAIISAHDSGLIKQSTALRELKQLAVPTGMWSNITHEEIEEADLEPPQQVEVPLAPGAPVVTPKLTAFDHATRWLRG